MSETTTTTTVETQEQKQGDPAEQMATDGGKRALDELRQQVKQLERSLKATTAERDELKAANLSELEKAQQAAKSAQDQLTAMQAREMRQRVALEKGLPANLVNRLSGDDEDSLRADADELLTLVNAPRTPAPDPTQGGGQGTTPQKSAAEQFADFTSDL